MRFITKCVADGRLPAYRLGDKMLRVNLDDFDDLLVRVNGGAE